MKIIFLDRDGVINRFPGKGLYVTRQEDFEWIPRSLEAICELTKAGYEIVVVSNQGCVSRGLITVEYLNRMTESMIKSIEGAGGKLTRVMYCLHQTSDACDCKKPKIKLFLDAMGGRNIDLKHVYFVGDSAEDMQAGLNLGCGKILVLSGRTQSSEINELPVEPDAICDNLWEAVQWLIRQKKS